MVLSNPRAALFGVGACALLLLFIGIHNSWDTVTYNVFGSQEKKADTETSGNKPRDDLL
jgi:hypothetical protein